MSTPLFLDLARCARDRARLAGAESLAARGRYWRELTAAATLQGHSWPVAEQLGREP